MKLGLSFSRCVLDIVEERVDIADVMLIVSRTDFDPRDDEQWQSIWLGYTAGHGWSKREWSHYYDSPYGAKFRNVALELYNTGKLHQPRQFGARPYRLPYFWLDVIIPPEDLANNAALKSAWDNLLLVAGLNGINQAHITHME